MIFSPLDPGLKEQIRSAALQCQAYDPAGWTGANRRFQDQIPAIEYELELDRVHYRDAFPEKITRFLKEAILGHVLSWGYVINSCGCWYGWMEDLQEHRASSVTDLIQAKLAQGGNRRDTPIEGWLAVCDEDESPDSSTLSMDNPYFLTFLTFLVNYYESKYVSMVQ